jgi:hypothetical protein
VAAELQAFDFYCTTEMFNDSYLGPGLSCEFFRTHIRDPNVTITSIDGITAENFDGSNHRILRFEQSRMSYMMVGLEKFFPNIDRLFIGRGDLEEVNRSDFDVFPKLRVILIISNRMTTLPRGLFDGNLELEQLIIRRNPIITVAHDLLAPLTKLHFANFFENSCIDIEASNRFQIPALQAVLNAKCPEV